jgi:DNA-binding NtrC family response regulator
MVSGVALAKELSQSHPAFRIVLMTGSGQAAKETRAQGFEVLQKPFSRAALEELIRAALHPAGDRLVAALSSAGRRTS